MSCNDGHEPCAGYWGYSRHTVYKSVLMGLLPVMRAILCALYEILKNIFYRFRVVIFDKATWADLYTRHLCRV